MKVRCVDDRPFLREVGGRLRQETLEGGMISLTKGKVYEVIRVERGWYRIVDDTDDDYLYPPHLFQVVQE
jgi:tRNA A22 N-methylase